MVEFRTIDGSENNPSGKGQAETPLIRLLNSAYEDGFDRPRGITRTYSPGDPRQIFLGPSRLPNPRKISNAVSDQNRSVPNQLDASDWIWQWGQFLDHDLDLNEGGSEPFFIPVDPDDPISGRLPSDSDEFEFAKFPTIGGAGETIILPFLGNTAGGGPVPLDQVIGGSETARVDATGGLEIGSAAIAAIEEPKAGMPFLPFTRIIAAPGTGEPGAPRAHINEITAFIDGSQVYGSGEELAELLRLKDGSGKLKSQRIGGEELLPFNPAIEDASARQFIAGDPRVNEQVALMSVHTLFLREHNRIADQLAARISAGDSEIVALLDASGLEEGDFIYESARKVVGAKIQFITYNEYLPLLIGKNLADNYGGYRSNVDPSISEEFANVSFRLGHSQLSPQIQRVDARGNRVESIALSDAFFDTEEVVADGADSILTGLTSQVSQSVDNLIVDGVRNLLFGVGTDSPPTGGFELAAVNIQRGRDVGLPSYNEARVGLGLKPAVSFLTTDSKQGITSDPETAARFASIYDSIDDVDFWVGGISEDPVNGGLVGELFSKVLTNQFTRLRDGDRFFYLTEREDLLKLAPNLEKTTLSRIISQNTSADFQIQDKAFIVPGLSVKSRKSRDRNKLKYTVKLSDISSSKVTVDFATADGTATAGEDYVATRGQLTFNPGETSKTITVALLDSHAVLKNNQTVLMSLSNASNQNIDVDLAVSQPNFDRRIIGSPSNDRLRGRFGNDLIKGLGGNDRLYGQFGNDFMVGGDGNDQLEGDFNIRSLKQLGQRQSALFKESSRRSNRRFRDRFGSNDTQIGGAGNDVINGGLGSDTQIGGDGDDTLNGDFNFGSSRQVSSENLPELVRQQGNSKSSLVRNQGNGNGRGRNNRPQETLDPITGLSEQRSFAILRSDDVQYGGDGNDSINGGYGNDQLTGAGLNKGVGEIDRLNGGFGRDKFVLGDRTGSFYLGKGDFDYALIEDFRADRDHIVLSGRASDYVLARVGGSLPSGVGIYRDLDKSGGLTPSEDDLIAISTQSISDFNRGFRFL